MTRRNPMYVVAEHEIKHQIAFDRGRRLMTGVGAPEGVRVLQFYPRRDHTRVLCLWESDSVAAVQRYVDDTLGDSSDNTCWEVDSEQAFSGQLLGLAESARV
jgi:hypothetical protein